jgi:hypothetical protein
MSKRKAEAISLDQLDKPERDTADERRTQEGAQTGKTDARHFRNRHRSKQVVFRTTPELWAQVLKVVEEEGFTVTDLVERAILKYIKELKVEKPLDADEAEENQTDGE